MIAALLALRESFARFVASKFAEAEGFRPMQSGDDAFYYVAHGDRPHLPHEIHGGVEVLHRSGDLQ